MSIDCWPWLIVAPTVNCPTLQRWSTAGTNPSIAHNNSITDLWWSSVHWWRDLILKTDHVKGNVDTNRRNRFSAMSSKNTARQISIRTVTAWKIVSTTKMYDFNTLQHYPTLNHVAIIYKTRAKVIWQKATSLGSENMLFCVCNSLNCRLTRLVFFIFLRIRDMSTGLWNGRLPNTHSHTALACRALCIQNLRKKAV